MPTLGALLDLRRPCVGLKRTLRGLRDLFIKLSVRRLVSSVDLRQYFVGLRIEKMALRRYRHAFFYCWQNKTHIAKDLFGSCLKKKTYPGAGRTGSFPPPDKAIGLLWSSPSGPLGVRMCNPNEKQKPSPKSSQYPSLANGRSCLPVAIFRLS